MKPTERQQAQSFVESILASLAQVSRYVNQPDSDIDPGLLHELVQIDGKLADLTETL